MAVRATLGPAPMREIGQIILVMVPLSLVSFGGGASILAPLHEAFVNQYRWISSREYTDFFAISRASPGPGAMLVALIGWKQAGWAGPPRQPWRSFCPPRCCAIASPRSGTAIAA